MAPPLVLALSLLLAADATLPVAAAAPSEGPTIPWVPGGLEAARKESRRLGRPMLLYVGATWCGACKTLESSTWRNADVARFVTERMVAAKVHGDSEEGKPLVQQMFIHGYPAITFVSPEGIELRRLSGYVSPEVFLERARAVLAEPVQVAALEYAVKLHPDDLLARGHLGVRYLDEGREGEALEQLRLVAEGDPMNVSTVADDALVALAAHEPDPSRRAELVERALAMSPDAETERRAASLSRGPSRGGGSGRAAAPRR